MKITYHEKTDLLYIRLDERPQQVTNREVSDDVILDMGDNGRIVGIEILGASQRLTAERVVAGRVPGGGVAQSRPATTAASVEGGISQSGWQSTSFGARSRFCTKGRSRRASNRS